MARIRALKASASIILLVLLLLPVKAGAIIFIDIHKSPRRLPIAVQNLSGPYGMEIADIVKVDLEATGLFTALDPAAFIEFPGHSFKRENWLPLGAEAVIKGFAISKKSILEVTISMYDVFEGGPVMKKVYRGGEISFRAIAHTIANDIYEKITGKKGVFRTKVAFVSYKERGGPQSLAFMDWDGANVIVTRAKAPTMLTPHWDWGGRKLIYSARRGRHWEVLMFDMDTSSQKRVFSSKGTIITGDMFPGSEEFALSSSEQGTPDIYTYSIPSGKLRRLTRDPGIEVSPTVSPDGNNIAYVSDRGGTPQIYTMDKIGYNRNRITFESKNNTAPAWSPRGDKLAFTGYYEGKNQIYICNTDGSGLELLTMMGNNEEPSFSPDGRFIVFSSDRDGSEGIYIMRSNGADQRKISPKEMMAIHPRWSPN